MEGNRWEDNERREGGYRKKRREGKEREGLN